MHQQEVEFDGSCELDYDCACECGQCVRGNHSFCELGVHFKGFNDLFCQAIDDSLSELFGASVLSSLHTAIEKHGTVNRDEPPYRPETMHQALEFVFGTKGAHTIEKRIIRRFYNTLELPFTNVVGYNLEDYVEAARKRITLNSLSSLREYMRLL
ncbi:MAG TPA: hypothetical protein VE862_01660 [Candidatus Acidoferrum sp.]|nr:hypothetical protein [Candidatus Acidoferrum sp.]